MTRLTTALEGLGAVALLAGDVLLFLAIWNVAAGLLVLGVLLFGAAYIVGSA